MPISPSSVSQVPSNEFVDVIYRFRWVPVALLALVSLGPAFGWQ